MRFYFRRVIATISGLTLAVFVFLQISLDKNINHSSNDVQREDHIPNMGMDIKNTLFFPLHDNHTIKRTPPLKVNNSSSSPSSFASVGHNNSVKRVWPLPLESEDRILAQIHLEAKSVTTKRILVYKGVPSGDLGRLRFVNHHCPVTDCELISDRTQTGTADVILFEGSISEPTYALHKSRPSNQIWILFFLESPFHTMGLKHFYGKVNWTATYRRDSTIVAPYERWVQFQNVTSLPEVPDRNYAHGKTKKVAWFVSNCHTSNGRLAYATELAKYIDVDIYGSCGNFECERRNSEKCYEFLRSDYKFYLAFENSNCKDYITEKLYWNAYLNDVVPIVMGARPEDYEKVAPPHSYIHVDNFATPRALADYLTLLNSNDKLYNQYFRWKGTGHFIDTKFWCRLCSMLHEASNTKHKSTVKDLESWWRGESTCIGASSENDWATWRKPYSLW